MDNHLNPVKILHKVEEIMPDNAILVADGGDFVGTAAYILRYKEFIISLFQTQRGAMVAEW